MAREQNEVEAIFDLVDAIFDGNSGHRALLLARLLRRDRVADGALVIVTRLQVQGVFRNSPVKSFNLAPAHGSVTPNFGNLVAASRFPDCELPRRRAAVIALAGPRHMARAALALIARTSAAREYRVFAIVPGYFVTMATSKF
jgi:hypothetical protein